jgi:predicted nucleic-acid-binding protein
VVFVLESFYEVARERIAELARAVIGFPTIVVVGPALLLRALEVYEVNRIDFAEAYLVASAEARSIFFSLLLA